MRWWSGFLVLFGIGMIVNAAEGQWAFTEKPTGPALVALDIAIGGGCFVASYALWRRRHRATLAVAIPGAKPKSAAGRTLSTAWPNQGSGMEFFNDAQRECYTAVRNWVSALYGESAWIDEEMPRFSVPVVDIIVGIGVRPVGEQEAGVNIWTFPLDEGEQELTEGALRFMLEANSRSFFGNFSIAPDSSVVFEYTVEWEGLTKERLRSLVVTIALASRDLRIDLARELTS
jgi:Putative bacterial sensory transduction regulator